MISFRVLPVMVKGSTSQQSWRQSLAQGGASAASGTLGNGPLSSSARFSGRKNLSPLSLVLLSVTIACGHKEAQKLPAVAMQSPVAGQSETILSENYPALVAQAQEVNEAFRRREFARMVDLTYPKAVEAAGGRDKMIESLTKGIKEMEGEGVVVLSSTTGAPTQIVPASGSIYAVLPTTLKVKAQDGVFQTESSMIGISSNGGATWTFIDAGGKDQKELRSILPDAVDKLHLPPEKPPVKISNN